MTDSVAAVRGLRMAYGRVVVLEDIDLTAAAGEIVAVTGINGAGKSTLLAGLAGFRRAAAGTVTVLGGPPRDDAAFWRQVAHVADQPTWYPGLTVREHLELVRMTHEPVTGWCLNADELIEAFGLTARADASPLTLSSGQGQRLSLAAALARPSRLLRRATPACQRCSRRRRSPPWSCGSTWPPPAAGPEGMALLLAMLWCRDSHSEHRAGGSMER